MKTTQSIETFDALLRDLLTWGLVEPVITDNAAQRTVWQLTQAAQHRLTELAAPLGPCPAHKIVFLDHFCADCQERRLTRLYAGVYLCDDCAAARFEEAADDGLAEAGTPGAAGESPEAEPPEGGHEALVGEYSPPIGKDDAAPELLASSEG